MEWLSLRGKTLKDLYLSTKRLDLQAVTEADAIEGRVDGTPSSDAKQGKISVKLAGHQEHCCWVNSLKFGNLESQLLKWSTEG